MKIVSSILFLGVFKLTTALRSFQLAHGWEKGFSAGCNSLQCTTVSGGLEACSEFCLEDPECNVFNFCPEGGDCTSGRNRCCRRSCSNMDRLELTTRHRGWDVYIRSASVSRDIPSFALVQGWEQGETSLCPSIQCTTESGGLEVCSELCLGNPECNVFNFCPEGADCTSGQNRCCLRNCDSTDRSNLRLSSRFLGWDIFVRQDPYTLVQGMRCTNLDKKFLGDASDVAECAALTRADEGCDQVHFERLRFGNCLCIPVGSSCDVQPKGAQDVDLFQFDRSYSLVQVGRECPDSEKIVLGDVTSVAECAALTRANEGCDQVYFELRSATNCRCNRVGFSCDMREDGAVALYRFDLNTPSGLGGFSEYLLDVSNNHGVSADCPLVSRRSCFVTDGLEECQALCTSRVNCDTFDFCPAGASCGDSNRCCLRSCGSDEPNYTESEGGWDIYIRAIGMLEKCYLEFCNSFADIRASACGGQDCTTVEHYRECAYRYSVDDRGFDLDSCTTGETPAPTPAPTPQCAELSCSECDASEKCFAHSDGTCRPSCDRFGACFDDPVTTFTCDNYKTYRLEVTHEQGVTSLCPNLSCTTVEGGLAECQALCNDDLSCKVINFCPEGSTCTSTPGRCCLRSECEGGDLQLTSRNGGWDVYRAISENQGSYSLVQVGMECPDSEKIVLGEVANVAECAALTRANEGCDQVYFELRLDTGCRCNRVGFLCDMREDGSVDLYRFHHVPVVVGWQRFNNVVPRLRVTDAVGAVVSSNSLGQGEGRTVFEVLSSSSPTQMTAVTVDLVSTRPPAGTEILITRGAQEIFRGNFTDEHESPPNSFSWTFNFVDGQSRLTGIMAASEFNIPGLTECGLGQADLTLNECITFGNERGLTTRTPELGAGVSGRCYVGNTTVAYEDPSRINTQPGFQCKRLQQIDGLEEQTVTRTNSQQAQESANACSDGDFVSFCAGTVLEFDIDEPMLMMRVQLRNRIQNQMQTLPPTNGRLNVEVFDGQAWANCVQGKVMLTDTQWISADCQATLYAERIRITSTSFRTDSPPGELAFAEVVPQGINVAAPSTEAEELAIKYETDEPWRQSTGVTTCTTSAVLRQVTCGVESTSSECVDPETTCRTLGLQCWAYSRTNDGMDFTISYLSAGASNQYECEGEKGFAVDRRSSVFRRPFKQYYDVAFFSGDCWTYEMATGTLTTNVGRECTKTEIGTTNAVAWSLGHHAECGLELGGSNGLGWEALDTVECVRRILFRQVVGRQMHEILVRNQERTRECNNGRRLKATNFDFAGTRRRQSRDDVQQCFSDANSVRTSRCNALREAVSAEVEVLELSVEIAMLQDAQAEDDANTRAWLNTLDGYRDTLAVARVGFGGLAGVGARRETVANAAAMNSRRRAGSEEYGPNALTTERRREPITIALGIAAVAGVASGVFNAIGNRERAEQEEQQIRTLMQIAEIDGEIGVIRAMQDALRQQERIAEVCDTTSNAELECHLQSLGLSVEESQIAITEAIDELSDQLGAGIDQISNGIGLITRQLDANNRANLQAFADQNAILSSQTMTLASIQDTLDRIQTAVQLQGDALITFRADLDTISELRREFRISSGNAGLRRVRNLENNNRDWCNMLEASATDLVLESVQTWATSEPFFRLAEPPRELSRREGDLWTPCEIADWATEFTQMFEAMQVLFEFAAMRLWYSFEYSEDAYTVIQDQRNLMAMGYNERLAEIYALQSDDVVRCVGDPVTCPVGYHHDENLQSVTRQPCVVNSCSCPENSLTPFMSELCVEHQVTPGCGGEPTAPGFHVELSEFGTPIFVPDTPFCSFGRPETNPIEADGFHQRELCDRFGCDEGATFDDDRRICVLERCLCQTGEAEDAAFGRRCPVSRRGLTAGDGPTDAEPTMDFCESCRSQAPESVPIPRTMFRETENCVDGNLSDRDIRLRPGCTDSVIMRGTLVVPVSTTNEDYLEIELRPSPPFNSLLNNVEYRIEINGRFRFTSRGTTNRIHLGEVQGRGERLEFTIWGMPTTRGPTFNQFDIMQITYFLGSGPVRFTAQDGNRSQTCGLPEGVEIRRA